MFKLNRSLYNSKDCHKWRTGEDYPDEQDISKSCHCEEIRVESRQIGQEYQNLKEMISETVRFEGLHLNMKYK